MSGAKYIVGIDLGTTNTVVAFAPVDARRRKTAPTPAVFEVDQLVTTTLRDSLSLLPSALYAPLPGEVDGDPEWLVGMLARTRAAEVDGRVITSSKSWLSHAGVDRTAAILPWGAEHDPKLSPVEAAGMLLAHVTTAWDAAHPDAPLARQDVILTLPASFDDVARDLTMRAAAQAGLAPTLLEEPTAAFYDAMRDVDAIREHVVPRAAGEERTVLVCDVGGGTTDLSLMAIAYAPKDKGGFTVRRVAVGRHILLGGDNMDLALAHLAESRLGTVALEALEPSELAQLVASCRAAKERILADTSVAEERVTVLGRGSRLVGGARSTVLTRAEVEQLVLGGFFPADVGDAPPARRGAIVAFGLPYERDPAITRHVRQFLVRHAAELPRGTVDVVLLNGGVFNAPPIVAALRSALAAFSGTAPAMLPLDDPDRAVARGAVRYGFARHGLGVRIETGASRGYYVGVGAIDEKEHLVCILPRGAKEGVHHEAEGRTFDLTVGRSVRFDLFASDVARDEAGALVVLDDDFERLPPVVAALPATRKEAAVRVRLGGELTTTGQLELSCSAVDDPARRYRLEFQLRDAPRSTSIAPSPASFAPPAATRTSIAPPSKLTEAEKILEHVFGKRSAATERETKDVLRDLDKALGDRPTWTMETCRFVVDRLLANPGARRRSAVHERTWWLLFGFGMRPGFGDPGDPARIERTWPLFEGRLGFPNEAQCWQQFFIAWRRIAGGLGEAMQDSLRDAIDPIVAPKEAGLKAPKRSPEDNGEALVMLSALERVNAVRRAQLGDWIVEKTWASDDARLWGAIGRLGARVPVYASVHHVVAPSKAEAWIERLLRLDRSKIATASHAAVQLARVTGDRARDVSERLRKEVEKKLVATKAKDAWVAAVRELAEVNEEERVAMLGEGLPLGLSLAAPAGELAKLVPRHSASDGS